MQYPSPTSPPADAPSVALVAYDSLGDGLIYLMIAENLRLNGFRVTCYGNSLSSLAGWLPQLTLRRYPDMRTLESELAGFDMVLCSPPSFVRHRASEAELRRWAERYVLICISRSFPEYWRVDHTRRIEAALPAEKARRLRRLAACSGCIRHRRFSGETMVQIAVSFMQERMGLEQVTPDLQLHAPAKLEHRRHRDRIVLCPDSATPQRKDWTPARIVDLAARFRAEGLDPKIVGAPANVDRWQRLAADVCEAPALNSVEALAGYLYESGVVVAGDSGSGHLASFLQVPTVTIHRRRNRRFAWRPGWAPGEVVGPVVTLGLGRTQLWRPFIPASKVVDAVERLSSRLD